MEEADVDACSNGEGAEALRFAVMRLWAAAMQIEQSFCQTEIRSIPGLAPAIEAVRCLPASIGWADIEADDLEA